MKKVKILSMRLENFKCHTHLQLDFMGKSASLYGNNAVGKTTVYDALTWLLFGKDSKGNGEKSIDIKPLDQNGNVRDHEAITSVEAVLQVDDQSMSIKRTLREIWSSKRGSLELTYDGNTSDYFVDGVPCKKFEYDRRIGEVVEEEIFRVLTSITYFSSEMDWKSRRKLLFEISGTMSEKSILQTEERFLPLFEACGHLSCDELKKKVSAERKGYLSVRDENPAKISALQEMERELSGLDFAAAKSEITSLDAKKESVLGQITALQNESAVTEQEKELLSVRMQIAELERENQAFMAEQREGLPNISALEAKKRALEAELAANLREIAEKQNAISGAERSVEDARRRWINVQGEVFEGGKCPTCGQDLPMEQLAAANERFEEWKKDRLEEIERTANSEKAMKLRLQERAEHLQARNMQIENEIAEIGRTMQAVPQIVPMEGFAEHKKALCEQEEEIARQILKIKGDSRAVEGQLRSSLQEINAAIATQQITVGKEDTLSSVREKISRLREESAAASAQMEKLDKLLWLIEDFTRYKMGFVEDTINSLFRIARFRLFREQANGGVEERCDVVFDGIPYASVNSGAKINVGIDIINTLSNYYGVQVPLFIDNAESVTRLEYSDTQVIRLVVSEQDKELRCEYEN
ncbi:MAG: hypothetical protein E7467_06150 [Ruminococcaceae bacterium]|nr:hypothetical protein [Oscillospiraceae bacterium]